MSESPMRPLRTRAAAMTAMCWSSWRAGTAALVGLAALDAVLGPLAAAAGKAMFDALAGGHSYAGPAVAVAAVGLGYGLVGPTEEFLRNEVGRRVGVRAPDELFAGLERVRLLPWFDDPESHDKVQLAQQVANQVSSLLLRGVLGSAQSMISLVGYVVVLLPISPTVTAALLVAAVPSLTAQLWLARIEANTSRILSGTERRRRFFTNLLTDYHAIREIRLFGNGSYIRERMTGELRAIAAGERRVDVKVLVANSLLALLSAGLVAGVVIYSAHEVATGSFRLGDMSAVLAGSAGTQAAVALLVGQLSQAGGGLRLFDSYLDVVRLSPDAAGGRPELAPLAEGIVFEDVWFRYPGTEAWILRGLTMTIPAGGTTALVGINGAGKSTLVALLCRLYDPTRGRITWDGVALADVDPEVLRRRISGVLQDYMNYDLSAAENIALSDPPARADRDRIATAARAAGIADTLEGLPRGYDTGLSRIFFTEAERAQGTMLSGGQWQRVALARGLFRADADLVILDEPTSGLDPQAEHDLRAELVALRLGRTTLLISHRLGGLRHAGRIVVVEAGQCIESGSHEELMRAGGRYAGLFALQAEDYQDTAGYGADVVES